MPHLIDLIQQKERIVAGLMSGTSLDGVDVAIARLGGTGSTMNIALLGACHVPYPDAVKTALLANSSPDTSSVKALSQLNVRLAHLYADAIAQALDEAGLPSAMLDLVGSHGQTVHHVPEAEPCAGHPTTSTFQIGDPAVLANLLGLPVVGDFRPADMALGGQGAPLAPYLDYIYLANPEETRLLLNLGGIANITVLPHGGQTSTVYAFDTGPSNMVIDALMHHLFSRPYDPAGTYAAQGIVDEPLLKTLLDDPFFAKPPPKSTGREHFGTPYMLRLLELGNHLDAHTLLATATALTVRSIHQAYTQFVAPGHPAHVLIANGGGVHNATLMQGLATHFAPIPVRTGTDYGLDPDVKEALCFAIFAHEFLNGVPTNLPSVTGARQPTLLGKLCLPHGVAAALAGS